MAFQRQDPLHTLQESLRVAQTIRDERAGKPMKRPLLAKSLDIKPSSSNFRDLLSSAHKYGLTDGTQKASEIKLTELGVAATDDGDAASRVQALRQAAMKPKPYRTFFTQYDNNKMPSSAVLKDLLVESGVRSADADHAADVLEANATFAGLVDDIGGSLYVMLDSDVDVETPSPNGQDDSLGDTPESDQQVPSSDDVADEPPGATLPDRPKPIFVGHGKRKGPRDKLIKILDTFGITYRVAESEPHLGRPIPDKVRQIMAECGSAILIFTRDEKLFDKDATEVWRPSENVVYELGAASFAYGDRIVIFKEEGIDFPTNFDSVGRISFEEDSIDAKAMDLLKELVGFGLVKVTPT